MESRTNTPHTAAQRELQSTIDLLESKADLALIRLNEHPTDKNLHGRYNRLAAEIILTRQRLAAAVAFGI